MQMQKKPSMRKKMFQLAMCYNVGCHKTLGGHEYCNENSSFSCAVYTVLLYSFKSI